jgi:Arc/MetJ-type ribon-helix-helix transcriptional regulator
VALGGGVFRVRGVASARMKPKEELDVKTLKIELPEQLAKKIEALVQAGWFANDEELTRLALSEFLRHHSFELQEQFQRDDIQWALDLKVSKA